MALQIAFLLFLLAASAFFSGSETALFSLTRSQREQFARSSVRGRRWAVALVRQPDRLLVTLLLGNMAVNVLFFATGSLLARDVARTHGGWMAAAVALAPLLAIIFFGEVAPKVLALSRPDVIAPLVSGPIRALTSVLAPVRIVLERACIRPAVRLLAPQPRPHEPAGPITPEQLQLLFAHLADGEVLDVHTRSMLHELVELTDIKVREVMLPRVDIQAFDLADSRDALLALLAASHLKRVPVFRGDLDHIVGIVHARDVLLRPETPIAELVKPVRYVPELATLEKLLTEFREAGRQLAIVVDEYGGVAGLVTLEDVVEEIVGEVYDPDDPDDEPYRQVGPDEYRLRGGLSIRDWGELFGQRLRQHRADTIAGLIAAELGRVPVEGDRVRIRNLELTVESVHRRRVGWVHLRRLDESMPAPEKERQG